MRGAELQLSTDLRRRPLTRRPRSRAVVDLSPLAGRGRTARVARRTDSKQRLLSVILPRLCFRDGRTVGASAPGVTGSISVGAIVRGAIDRSRDLVGLRTGSPAPAPAAPAAVSASTLAQSSHKSNASGGDHRRHAVMQRAQGAVGRGGDDAGRLHLLAVRPHPGLPQARECDQAPRRSAKYGRLRSPSCFHS